MIGDITIEQHPEAAARLAEGYEKWWQSIMAEGPNERYAYLKAGSPKENPIRISAHDVLIEIPIPFAGFQKKADLRSMQHFRHWKERSQMIGPCPPV